MKMMLFKNRHKSMNYAKAAATRPTDKLPTHHQRPQQAYEPREGSCWNCEITGHNRESCRHQGPHRCHGCGRYGHKVCYCQQTNDRKLAKKVGPICPFIVKSTLIII